jgi:hypothetical protein
MVCIYFKSSAHIGCNGSFYGHYYAYILWLLHTYYIYWYLKVPKRENFSLAFFALSKPIWVCDLGSGKKNRFFYQMIPDFESLWFFAAY